MILYHYVLISYAQITVNNSGGNGIYNVGTINNDNTITVSNSGGTGINNNSGTINNTSIICGSGTVYGFLIVPC